MNIAILVSGFPPKWLGGTEIATYNIAKYLTKIGHEVHVITLLDEGLPKKEIKEEFYIHRIKLHSKVPFISIIVYMKDVFACIKEIQPDVVHCQNLAVGWMAFIIKIFLKYPYVIYGRGSDIYTNYRFKNTILKLVIKNANAVVVLTKDMKKEVSKIHSREIFVIPNGISINNYGENQSDDIYHSNNEKIILYVGTLRSIKGINYLIEAMKIISQNCLNTKLLLVGDGEERKSLENLVDELDLNQHITFVGRVSNEDVPKYMAASDVFVLPSLSEGFPNVILEAMASGLPIVTTKIRGLPEIVKDGINGFLVEPENPGEIAENVIYLLKNTEIAHTISENNKKDVEQYAWENVVKEIESTYLICV
jgi:glycosyltransferase involved in cell wall biosynthesis